MLHIKDNIFHINTKNSSYIFRVTKHEDLEHLYYGERIEPLEDYNAFFQNRSLLLVSALYPKDDVTYGIDDICFEYSFSGFGDMRENAGTIFCNDRLCRFHYSSYEIINELPTDNPNAQAYNADNYLVIELREDATDAVIKLYYGIFYETDIISRLVEVCSNNNSLIIDKLMSAQLDFDDSSYKMLSFDGAWSRERYKHERTLTDGKFVIDSISGASSARHNPFVIFAKQNADEYSNACYAFNLVYSGNHYEAAEVTPYNSLRFLSGINPNLFEWKLSENQHLFTPECVMTFSANGYHIVSENMHRFVQNHIVRGYWKDKDKPILLNSWEAMYFDINEQKIKELADCAADIGAELLVIDDGWFGKRNDDTSSLGDWQVNKSKFPNSITSVSDYVHNKGLMFGIWFEPEMISENSRLFESNPDWALNDFDRKQITGRNQLILDLTRTDVQKYIIESISGIICEAGIDYIKWDFNRMLSSLYSHKTACQSIMHEYILGLYKILACLTEKHPKVLFELCASGGSRFDLGMLCYMPVGWVSDNTDAFSRTLIQEGTSYCYPPSVMCNHISVCPNHQTKRSSSLLSRFSTASFGMLGLQYDLTKLSKMEFDELKHYIELYKVMRPIIKNGRFYRLLDGLQSNYSAWLLMSDDRSTGYIFLFQKLFQSVSTLPKLKLHGLIENEIYEIADISVKAFGSVLMKNGVIFPQNYQGNEYSESCSNFYDFTGNIYKITKCEDND